MEANRTKWTVRGDSAHFLSEAHGVEKSFQWLRLGLVAVLVLAGILPARAQEAAFSDREDVSIPSSSDEPSYAFRFKDHDLHPDRVFQPYMGGPMFASREESNRIQAFREFLGVYEQRQGEDDNFTIRVLDNRTNETLEVYELATDRARYRRTGEANWRQIDEKRRAAQKRLLEKWRDRLPASAVSVRWGRANEVREARDNETAFIEHEVHLARYLGLSLLATEIGTVETFNQDRLVSSVGARTRYQMMPYLLRKNKINRYQLRTPAGSKISVNEEWHPLITMEPAFQTLRAYVNATGHEIPGISAYHTGPGNIYKVYQKYLQRRSHGPSVVDAYIWAVTDGFDSVSSGTSFGSYSRSYVASAYGALRATENLPIDTSKTFLGERVQIRPGRQILLSELLRVLERNDRNLSWGGLYRRGSFYERFRKMNPHISLPASFNGAVPVKGDVRLTDDVDGKRVRFFLPLGATDALNREGVTVIDPRSVYRFDHQSFTDGIFEKTQWDREYESLVDDIGRFGFTWANRSRLATLKNRFEELAAQNPTHYRLMQERIITEHDNLWRSGPWEELASVQARTIGSMADR